MKKITSDDSGHMTVCVYTHTHTHTHTSNCYRLHRKGGGVDGRVHDAGTGRRRSKGCKRCNHAKHIFKDFDISGHGICAEKNCYNSNWKRGFGVRVLGILWNGWRLRTKTRICVGTSFSAIVSNGIRNSQARNNFRQPIFMAAPSRLYCNGITPKAGGCHV